MRYLLSFCATLLVTAMPSLAQIELNTNGNAAMGPSIDDVYKLRTECSSTTSCGEGSPYVARGGVKGSAIGGYANFGVRGEATNGYYNYGVYGYASGGTNNWGGYFSGSVYTTGSYQSSDSRLKSDVRALDGESVLISLMEILPRRFKYLTAETLKSGGLPPLELPTGDHFGFIAQELEGVFPEMVTDVAHPSPDGAEVLFTKAVNYAELIPVLVKAVQTQQEQIEAMKAALDASGIVVE